jgi:tRNA A37 threonylcarbamoyladenosine biosynthesis protein TsaE
MDLYRLSGQEQDLVPLNLDKAFAEDVSLIEWPQRLGDKIPTKRLELNLQIVDTEDDIESDGDCQPRLVALTPIGKEWEDRLEMLQAEGYVDDWIISDNE